MLVCSSLRALLVQQYSADSCPYRLLTFFFVHTHECTVCAAFVICFFFAREEGYWVVTLPFLPLTIWMALKVRG